MKNRMIVHVLARAADEVFAIAGPQTIGVSDDASAPLPNPIVWMPAGTHQISAHTAAGGTFTGVVHCDEQACRAVQASQSKIEADGRRVWFDFNHDEDGASAWVDSFSWDPARGILAHLKWTGGGERALIDRTYRSFSPAFALERETGRVLGLLGQDHSAGGLVNAQAFTAMPALIAARLAANPNTSGHNPEEQQKTTMKNHIIALLAALKVQVPADVTTEEQYLALFAKHYSDTDTAHSAAVSSLKSELAQVQASLAAKKAADDKAATDTIAVAAKAAQDKIAGELAEVKAALSAVQAGANGRGGIQVTASVEDLAKGYAKLSIKNDGAMDRGIFFRDNIAPVLAKMGGLNFGQLLGRALPVLARNVEVLAANSLGTLVGNLVAQQSLALLVYEFPELGMFTTDFSNASAKLNQTVYTRIKSAIAASHYTGTFTAADSTDSDVPVVIDTHTYAQVAFNANELGSTNRDLFGEQAEVLNYAVGKDIIDAIYALMVIAKFTTTALVLGGTGGGTATTDGTGYNRQSAIFAGKKLSSLKIPKKGRFNLLNSDAFGGLLSDSAVVSMAAFLKPEVITENTLPRIAGFANFEAVNLPTTGNMVSFAGTQRALAIATRVPNDYTTALSGSSYGNVATVTDPNTGMTVMNTQYVNHDTGTSNSRVSVMRGVAVGDPSAGLITVHA